LELKRKSYELLNLDGNSVNTKSVFKIYTEKIRSENMKMYLGMALWTAG
jgi:hypothetical protein